MILPKNVKNTPDRVRQRGTTRVAFANGLTTGSVIKVKLGPRLYLLQFGNVVLYSISVGVKYL